MNRSFASPSSFAAHLALVLGLLAAAGPTSAGGQRLIFDASSESKLLPAATEQLGHDGLGFAIAFEGTTLAAVSGADFDADEAGAAFVFQHDGIAWVHRATLRREMDSDWRWMGDVAISGSAAVVGASRDLNSAGVETGAAYIFQDSGGGDWSSYSTLKIEASDGVEGDLFGWPVALWGRTLLVGGGGAVYVFTDTSAAGDWSAFTESKIAVSTGEGLEAFDVDHSAGEPHGDTIAARNEGGDLVYVLRDTSAAHDWSSFSEVQLLIPFDEPFRQGRALSIDGRTIATGGVHRFHGVGGKGSVFVFTDTSAAGDWSVFSAAEVFATDPLEFSDLGWSVEVKGSLMLVGAPQLDRDEPWAGTGAAYIFEDTSGAGDWSSYSETRLSPPSVAVHDLFGFAVALDGPVAAVGAHYGETAAFRDGFVDLFDGDAGWAADQRLIQAGIGDRERQRFGERVGTDGRTVVVSAPGDDLDMVESGSLFVYQEQDGAWVEKRQVAAAETLVFDRFGQGLAVGGERLFAVGSGSHNDDPGAVPAPAHLTMLTDTSPDGDWGSYSEVSFPYDHGSHESPVAADGRNVAVGDAYHDDLHQDQGVVHLFHDDSPDGDWSSVVERELSQLPPHPDSLFGYSVDLEGRVMLVGARHDGALGAEAGAAFLLVDTSTGGDWSSSSQTRATASDADLNDHFGAAVALEGNWAVVGAPGDDEVGADAGSAYLLRDASAGGDWSVFTISKLLPPDPALLGEGAGFGSAVAGWGRFLVVGAPSADNPDQPGSVWLFVDTSPDADWSSSVWARVVPSDSAPGDSFGAAVAINHSTIVIGAPTHTEGDLTTGAAYVYEGALPGPDVAVALVDVPDPVAPGESLSYQVTLTNQGTETAAGIELNVTFRPEIEITGATGMGWTCSTAGGQVVCTLEQLNVGAVSRVAINTTAPVDRGSVTAAGTISADLDVNTLNDSAQQVTTVLGDFLFSDDFESSDLGAWAVTKP